MTTSPTDPAEPDPREGSQQHESPERPELYVVRPGAISTDDDGITPEAPWQYRLGERIAELADALPGLWANRQPSYAERVQYALNGDWTTAAEGQSVKRTLHLIGVLACLVVDGLLVTPLRAATTKPSRLGLLLLAVLLLAYAL